METKYDKKIDAKYVRIKKGKIAHTKKERDWLLFDYAENGDVLGVEILNASKHFISFRTIKEKLVGYSTTVSQLHGDDNESLGLTITTPEHKNDNEFAFA